MFYFLVHMEYCLFSDFCSVGKRVELSVQTVTGASGQSLLVKTTFPCIGSRKASALSCHSAHWRQDILETNLFRCFIFTDDLDAAARLIADDDDMLGKNIQMPWWDPNYVRPDKKQNLVRCNCRML